MRICIDPGHGGYDPGAIGNSLKEKDLNLNLSKMVAGRLMFYGVDVIMTRTTDADLGLYERCEIANSAGAKGTENRNPAQHNPRPGGRLL